MALAIWYGSGGAPRPAEEPRLSDTRRVTSGVGARPAGAGDGPEPKGIQGGGTR